MRLSFKNIFAVLKSAFKRWWKKDPFRESSIIAYYSIFSLPGLLVVIMTMAGTIFGRDVVDARVASQITAMMGKETADEIQKMVTVASERKDSVWATVIGLITIIVGATGVFGQFQKSLNIIWEVKASVSKSGLWELVRVRLFSFGLILSIAFILIASLVISSILAALGKWVAGNFSESMIILLNFINFIVSLVILAFLFALMFKFFPDAKIKWSHVWIGSLVTALLFDIGKLCLGLYFGTANPGTGYGAAGSLILILLWVSYSSMIVFYGAEFTRAYATMQDGIIPPDKHAVKQIGRKV